MDSRAGPMTGIRRVALGGLLLAAVAAAYAPALRAGFVWDDDFYVTDNPLLDSAEGLGRIWSEPTASPQYYPAVFTTFWLERRLWGDDPLGYHVVNVLLHGANALLAGLALEGLGVPGAWLAAWAFALHPVHVESVAWVAERKNVLSGLFYLGAVLCFLRFAGLWGRGPGSPPPASRPTARPWWCGASAGLFVLALLSKSVTASLPAVLLLILWWKRGRASGRELAALGLFLALGAAAGAHTAWLEAAHVGARGAEWDSPWVERALVAGRVPFFYLAKLLWPAPLMFIYPRWEIDASSAGPYLYPAALVGGLLLLWRLAPRVGRGPAAAALAFVVTLFPVLGFLAVYPMRFSFVADHFQYLASLGPLAALSAGVAAAGARAAATTTAGRARRLAPAVVVAALALLTWERAGAFRDAETLWRDTLRKNPSAWLAHNNLGRLLFDRGRAAEAEAHYREALRLKPGFREAGNNLAVLLAERGDVEESARLFESLAAADGGFAAPRYNLGRLAAAAGRRGEAEGHFRDALRADPADAGSHYELALLLASGGRAGEAVAHLEDAVRLQPRNVEALFQLGAALQRQGQSGRARESYRRVLELDASHVEALNNLASQVGAGGDLEEAARLFARAVELRPGDPLLRVNRARALAALGRREEAAAELGEALRQAPGDEGIREELRALGTPP